MDFVLLSQSFVEDTAVLTHRAGAADLARQASALTADTPAPVSLLEADLADSLAYQCARAATQFDNVQGANRIVNSLRLHFFARGWTYLHMLLSQISHAGFQCAVALEVLATTFILSKSYCLTQ